MAKSPKTQSKRQTGPQTRASKRAEMHAFQEKLLHGSLEEGVSDKQFPQIAKQLEEGDLSTLSLLFAGCVKWSTEEWKRVFSYLESRKKQNWKRGLEALSLSPDFALEVRLRFLEYLAQQGALTEPSRLEEHRSAKALGDHIVSLLETAESPESLMTVIPEFQTLSPLLIHEVIRTISSQRPDKVLLLYEALLTLENETVFRVIADLLKQHPTEKAAQLLQHILQHAQNKEIQKIARRSLYHLQSTGIKVEPPHTEPEVPPLAKPQFQIRMAMVSPIDGAGYRAVWLARTKPFGGYNMVHLLLQDQEGIKECFGAPITKKELPEFLREMQRDDFPLIEIDSAYCQHLIAEAYQTNLRSGTEVPREYFRLREIIGEPERSFTAPLIYQELPTQEIEAQPYHLANSAQLLNSKEFQSWYIPQEMTEKYLPKLQEMEVSPIIVSPMAQKEREEDILKALVEEFFTPEMTARYQRRLEEMAYLLLRMGREAEARMAFAVALALRGKQGKEVFTIPFIRKIVERSFFKSEEEEEQAAEREQGGLIIPSWR